VREPRNLEAAVARFLKRSATKAHDAEGDITDTFEVGLAMLDAFGFPKNTTVKDLSDLCFPRDPNSFDGDTKFVWNDANQLIVKFGKHRDRPVQNVPNDYWQWFVNTPNVSKEVRQMLLQYLSSGKPPTRG
jgi:hypothetical protein